MVSWLRYRWTAYRLNREMRSTERFHDRLKQQAKEEGKSATEIFELEHQASIERGVAKEELAKFQSRYLLDLASRLGVPLPQDEGSWDESYQTGGRYLNRKGYA